MLVVLLKPAVAAALFTLFCRVGLKEKNISTILFGVCYGMCSWQFATMKMNSLIDGLYFLPLLLLQIKRFKEKGRCIPLILGYTLTFIGQFYMGYIAGLASFGYFLLDLYLTDKDRKKGKELTLYIVRYAECVIIAGMISACVLLPAAYYALRMNTSDYAEAPSFHLSLLEALYGLSGGRGYELDTSQPYLYCGTIVILSVLIYLLYEKIRLKERVTISALILGFVLSLSVPSLYMGLHMFDYPNGYTVRYAFVIVLLLCLIGVRLSRVIAQVPFRRVVFAGIFWVLLIGVVTLAYKDKGIGGGTVTSERIVVTLLAVMGLLLVFWLNRRGLIGRRMMAVLIGCMTFAELLWCGSRVLGGDAYRIRMEEKEREEQAVYLTKQIRSTDNDLYRLIYHYDFSSNQSAWFGYHAISSFSSARPEKTAIGMETLGYTVGDFTMSRNGHTPLTDMLFAERYILDPREDVQIIAIPKSLNYGYMTSLPEEYSLEGKDPFENQERLIQTMTREKESIFEKYTGAYEIECVNADCRIYENGEISLSRIDPSIYDSYVKFSIPCREEYKAYIWFDLQRDQRKGSPYVRSLNANEKTLTDPSVLFMPHIVEMGKEDDRYSIYISFPQDGINSAVIEGISCAYFRDEDLAPYYDNLSENEWNVISYREDGHIEAEVTATEDKPMLFVSIPYEEGWHAYVDGEETDVAALADDAFIGVNIPAGKHHVTLDYVAPMETEGKIVSALGMLLLIVLLIRDGKAKNNK